jgi:hypothetical protein
MATAGQKYGISGSINGGWTFAGNLNMPVGTLNNESAKIAITAGTTRTQAGATALANEINRIDTSTAPSAGTTLGDGVVLPAAAGGLDLLVWNNTVNPIQVYANGSDTINGVAGATGIMLPPGGVYIFLAASTVSWACDGVGAGASGQFPTVTTVDGLTAHAGGGQGSALALPAQINRVTVVGSAADSVILPASKAGMQIITVNGAASNSMNVFPATGETINALSANTAFAVAAGKTCQFFCPLNGAWHALLSA